MVRDTEKHGSLCQETGSHRLSALVCVLTWEPMKREVIVPNRTVKQQLAFEESQEASDSGGLPGEPQRPRASGGNCQVRRPEANCPVQGLLS